MRNVSRTEVLSKKPGAASNWRLWTWRFLMLVSHRETYRGIRIFDLRSDDEGSQDYFDAVKRALDLIAEKAPSRLERIKHDMPMIVVLEKDGGAFWPALRACILTPYHLRAGTSEMAITIIHEAIHARLHGCGIPYSTDLRERIEKRCIREETAFAQLLPDATALIEKRSGGALIPWWSDLQLFERDMNYYRRIGAPEWLVRLARKRYLARHSTSELAPQSGGEFAMPIIGKSVSAVMKIALTLWGIVSVLLGAAQSVGLDTDAPHSNWAGAFVLLSYYSVLIIGMFGLIWSRIVSALLGLSALCGVTILVLAQPGANGLGLGLSFVSALGVILRGPVLTGLIYFVISCSELSQRTNKPV